jgi:hypothetical protein
MNTETQLNSFEINRNDLVLIIGESMGSNSKESVKLAQGLASGGSHGTVLFVNSYQRPHKFQLTVKEALGQNYDIKNNTDNLRYSSCLAGNLPDSCRLVEQELESGVSTIVINCWELAARDPRLRERLLFQILHWMHLYSITVILYAQKSSAIPKAGYAQRGGFGKLAGAADQVINAFEAAGEGSAPTKRDIHNIPFADLTSEEQAQWYQKHKEREKNQLRSSEPLATLEDEGLSDFDAKAIEEFSEEIDESETVIKAWDKLGIPRNERRVYFYGNPQGMKFAHIVEERMSKKRIHCRSVEVDTANYDFPETVPLEYTPEVGVRLESYLGRYRKTNSVNVQNDVEENQGVAGQVLRMAA